MKVSISQPTYLPYLGFFDRINKTDIFIVYDDAQFVTRGFHQRNKIRTRNGWKWLTVPVEKTRTPIMDVRIKETSFKNKSWQQDHLDKIKIEYRSSRYYDNFIGHIEEAYNNSFDCLLEVNMEFINLFIKLSGIETKIYFSSDLNVGGNQTQKLISLIKAVGGTGYVSGPSGPKYMETELFHSNGIELEIQKFSHPIYKQNHPDFVPNLSYFDFLLNMGPNFFI